MTRAARFTRSPEPDVAASAALIGDPGRAAMLLALLDGGELPASELASRARMTPQAATAHLKKLLAGGLLAVRTDGRHRLFRLSSEHVGHALEHLASIAQPREIVALAQQSTIARLREARSCYDHLAGRLGVAITSRLIDLRVLRRGSDEFEVTSNGARFFRALDVDVDELANRRRTLARACLDWTERRYHLAGTLGAALRDLF